MAGDWIKMRTDLQDDPEVLRLSSMLKLDRFAVVGRLATLWAWADKHTTDGTSPVTPLLLDDVVSFAGFSDALVVVGWLDVTDKGIKFPKFSRHNGKSAKKRALTARRVATHKKRKGNAVVTLTALPREEKRRDITPIVPLGFAEFWTAYPATRRVGKGKCLQAWTSKNLEPRGPEIVAHVVAMRQTDQWRKDGGQYVPTTLTYLNQDRFADGAPDMQPRRVAL